MTRPSALNPESPYAPGQEFGPELDGTVERWAARQLPVEHSPHWVGIGEPEFAEEARAAAGEGVTPIIAPADRRRKRLELPYAVSPSGVQGFVAPAPEPISESALAKAVDAVEAARDRFMRSRREE